MPQAVVPAPSILMVDGVLFRKVFDRDDGVGHEEMRSAKCGVRNAECEMRSAKCGVRNAECEMRSAKCGVRSAKRKYGSATRLCGLSACNKNREELSDLSEKGGAGG
jgi:hypothetical protein